MLAFARGRAQTRRSEHRQVIAFSAAARENNFARPAFENGGDPITRIVQRGARLLTDMMHAGWIAKNAVEVRQHGGAYVRIERRSGVVIEINRAHTQSMPQTRAATSAH